MRSPTYNAINDGNLNVLQKLRESGMLKWADLSYAAIDRRTEIIKTIFQWSIEDGVETVSYASGQRSWEKHMTDVIAYFFNHKELSPEEIELIELVACFIRLDYDYILRRLVHSQRAPKNGNFDHLMRFIKENGYQLDFQSHIEAYQNYDYGPLLKDLADRERYRIDWQAVIDSQKDKCGVDVRRALKWGEEDRLKYIATLSSILTSYGFSQPLIELIAKMAVPQLQIDYQHVLESCLSCRETTERVIFYLDRAKDKAILDSIDFAKLLELSPEYEVLLHSYIPDDYCPPDYPDSFEIDLAVEDEKLMEVILKYTYDTTTLDHVIYNGLDYYPRDSNCYSGPSTRPPHDNSADECEEHDGDDRYDCNYPPKIHPDAGDTLEYRLAYEPTSTKWKDSSYEGFEDIIRKIQHANPNKIMVTYASATVITLHNLSGFNHDHRGANHCKVDPRFEPYYKLELPCTLMDLMKAAYWVKSHKWDKWYELFSGATPVYNGNYELSYDHGS